MAEQKGNFANVVRTFYFYFFAGLGLVLLIIGIFQLSNWGVKSHLLPKYDLSFEETRCDYTPAIVKPDGAVDEESADEQKKRCQDNLESQRKTKKVTDLAQAVTFIIVGGIVFVFHFRKTALLHR